MKNNLKQLFCLQNGVIFTPPPLKLFHFLGRIHLLPRFAPISRIEPKNAGNSFLFKTPKKRTINLNATATNVQHCPFTYRCKGNRKQFLILDHVREPALHVKVYPKVGQTLRHRAPHIEPLHGV